MSAPLLEITDLHASLVTRYRRLDLRNGVSLMLERGEALGLVGESGSSKSLTTRAVMRMLASTSAPLMLVPPTSTATTVVVGSAARSCSLIPTMVHLRAQARSHCTQSPGPCLPSTGAPS